MVVGSPRTKKFLFVPVYADSNDEASRKLIRAHVMRETHYQKVMGTELGGIHRPVNYQTGQLGLLTSPARARLEAKSSSQLVVHRSRQFLLSTNTAQEPIDCARRNMIPCYPPSIEHGLPIIPSQGKIDPFESLPISFGSQQQMLLSYCKCYSLSRSVVCGYDAYEFALSTEAYYKYASGMKSLGHKHCYTITTELFVIRPRNPMRLNSLRGMFLIMV